MVPSLPWSWCVWIQMKPAVFTDVFCHLEGIFAHRIWQFSHNRHTTPVLIPRSGVNISSQAFSQPPCLVGAFILKGEALGVSDSSVGGEASAVPLLLLSCLTNIRIELHRSQTVSCSPRQAEEDSALFTQSRSQKWQDKVPKPEGNNNVISKGFRSQTVIQGKLNLHPSSLIKGFSTLSVIETESTASVVCAKLEVTCLHVIVSPISSSNSAFMALFPPG